MPCKQVSLFIGALLGKTGGFVNQEFFRGGKKSVSPFLCWTERTLRFQVWGPSGNLVKEQGIPFRTDTHIIRNTTSV